MPVTENDARQALQRLLEDFNRLSADDRAQMTEASVVRQFIDQLLRDVLGWPIEDPQRYKYELATQAGQPDITLIPATSDPILRRLPKSRKLRFHCANDERHLE